MRGGKKEQSKERTHEEKERTIRGGRNGKYGDDLCGGRKGRMAGTFVRGGKKERSKVGTHANMARMESEHTSCCH